VKKPVFFGGSIAWALFVFFGCSHNHVTDDSQVPVAWVNGEPIAVGEYKPFLISAKHTVYVQCRANDSSVRDLESFWNTERNSIVPIKEAQKRALDAAVTIKVQQIFAKKTGIMPDISYGTFLKNLASAIANRKRAIAEHRIVYGPEPDQSSFANNAQGEIRKAIIEKLKNSELNVTDSQIEAYYIEHKQKYKIADTISFEALQLPFDKNTTIADYIPGPGSAVDSSVRQATKQIIDKMLREARQGATFEKIADRYKKFGAVRRSLLFGDRIPRMQPVLVAMGKVADSLEVGVISNPFEIPYGYAFVRLLTRREAGYIPLDKEKFMITHSLLEDNYGKFIDSLYVKAKVKINTRIFNHISVQL
jgi:parvulin-like peptidyl-prolyl isomerase